MGEYNVFEGASPFFDKVLIEDAIESGVNDVALFVWLDVVREYG